MNDLWAGVELGGTKSVAAVARDPLQPLKSMRAPTGEPSDTLEAIADFFAEARSEFGPLKAIGIGAFGPVDIRRGSPGWGRIGATPKPGWKGIDVAAHFQQRLGCPVALDTDVNAAALAEARWGAGRGLGSFAYLTVGTGIGGGIIVDGWPIHGAFHPEIGHVRIRRNPEDDHPSLCPFHDDCAEGLASGPAIMARFGRILADLPTDHPFRAILADYLGQLCATIVLIVSPERIIIGGGVGMSGAMHKDIQRAMREWLNGYAEPPQAKEEGFVVPPELGNHAGLAGALALAQDLGAASS